MVNEIVFVKSSHRREQEEKSTEGENTLPSVQRGTLETDLDEVFVDENRG